MYIALNGYDADNDALTFTAASSNAGLTTSIPDAEQNASLRISTTGYSSTGEVGTMTFQLFEQLAPEVTARIIELANLGFYDGLTFHRIMQDYMIQGGDPTGTGYSGSGVEFDDYYSPDLRHSSAGVLSMAKSTDDTNDSQFFITNSAQPGWDFNHSVFGFLTTGDDVRAEIAAVATDSNNMPLSDVTMTSVDVYIDHENGVLILNAPTAISGPVDVTVTVSDGNGGTAQQTFHVTVASQNSSDSPYVGYDPPPYMTEIAPIEMKAGNQYTFTIPAADANGSAIYYEAVLVSQTNLVHVSTSLTTGQTTITADPTAVGIYTLQLRVAASETELGLDPSVDSRYAYYNDTQLVALCVSPQAPTVDLLAGSDTGLSSTDNITGLDNTSGNVLQFRVTNTVNGAVVSLYVDGQTTPIGQATASGTEVTITTNGTLDLADGVHSFWAVQELENQTAIIGNYTGQVSLLSDTSATLAVTIDTSKPQFTSNTVLTAAQGALYTYNAETDDEATGNVRYTLEQSVAGMAINQYTGQVTWTPTVDQVGTVAVTVRATSVAGQYSEQSFQVTIINAPTVDAISPATVNEGELLAFTASATDEGTDPLVYSLENAPEGAAIDGQTGEFTWTADESQGPGTYEITVAVANTAGAIGRQTFSVTVGEVNTPPQLEPIADCMVYQGQELRLQAIGSDADLPAGQLTFQLGDDAPAGAQIDAQTGELTWTPSGAQTAGEYPMTVIVSDAAGATASVTFTVTVEVAGYLPPTLVDRVLLAFGQQSSDSGVGGQWSLAMGLQTAPTVNRDAPDAQWLLPDTYRDSGLIGRPWGVQGGGNGIPRSPVSADSIDAPAKPAEGASGRASADNQAPLDLTDVALEALAREAEAWRSDAEPSEPAASV